MNKEQAYWYRAKRVPYQCESVISKESKLTMFENFDGENVTWGVREAYEDINGIKYGRSTPVFENMVDSYNYDKERIIYLKNNRIIIHGKIKGSEVLCRINDDLMYPSKPLVTIENFGGDSVHISRRMAMDEEIRADVSYKEDGMGKHILFDLAEFKPYSNVFDGLYADNSFLKHFESSGKLRTFIGIVNTKNGVVKPIGYDVNKKTFIEFPLTDAGLIDEKAMMEDIENEKIICGIDKETYKNVKNLRESLVFLLSSAEAITADELLDAMLLLHEKNRNDKQR